MASGEEKGEVEVAAQEGLQKAKNEQICKTCKVQEILFSNAGPAPESFQESTFGLNE